MKLLTKTTDYNETIKVATTLKEIYNKQVIFHCYWNGNLNEKHLYSVLSCYFFNVLNNKHKIFLWLENNISNDINKEISKYCEIKQFALNDEKERCFIKVNFIIKENYHFIVMLLDIYYYIIMVVVGLI